MADTTRLSLAAIRERGQRHAHLQADPTYARRVMRRLSPFVTYAVVNFTSLSADAVTYLSISLGIVGGLLTAIGSVPTNLLAVLLLQLAYLLDVADGEVARVRRTTGKRGTYLDLVGHFLQNRALYAGATFALILATDFAWWAIAIALLGVGFASAFGEQARQQVLGGRASLHELHGGPRPTERAMPSSPAGRGYWLYRRAAFLWSYPASMNLFCLALLADLVRYLTDPAAQPLVLPAFAAVFVVSLALKQLANAIRLLRAPAWSESA